MEPVEERYHSAAEVMRAALEALEAERWADVVPFVPPDALQRYRDVQIRWMLELEQRPPRTADELRSEQPWLSRDVAAAYAEQERTHLSAEVPAMRAQWGVASFRELEALSPAAFFVRSRSASTPDARRRAALAISHRPPEDIDGAGRGAGATLRRRWAVLGEVAEGSDKAHVVYRETNAAEPRPGGAGDVRVTTLDYVDGQWWLRMTPPLLDQGWSFVWAPDAGGSPP